MIEITKPFAGKEGARLVVFALATSGLAPASNCLLEVAAVAIDRALPPCFTDTFSATLQHDPEELLGAMDQKVAEAHAENGLLDILVDGNGGLLDDVDPKLAAWLDRIGATGERTTPLIAHGVDWTESWLAASLPMTLKRLGRDRIDVGCLLRAYDVPRKKGNGRALSEAMFAAQQFGSLFPGVSTIERIRKESSAQ